jgi:hypothetical protein
MAVFTRFRGRNVGIGFTDRIHIVVAALTTADYIAVIESDAAPGLVRDMAVVTGSRSLHVRARFTRCSDAVMAAFTSSADHRVVKIEFCPTAGRGMTALAGRSGGNVGI